MVSFLTPTAVLHPIKSINVFSLARFFFLHLGVRNTSNLLGLHQTLFDVVGSRARSDREHRARRWETEHGAGRVLRNQRQPARSNPHTGPIDMMHSAGSLECEGRVMARPQNRGWSSECQAEGKRTFSWVQQEGHVNEATVTDLHERYKWKRTTINGDKSLEISFPFFGCGAVY